MTPPNPGFPGAEWLELRAPLPPRGEELLLVDALHRVGARAVKRDGGGVAALVPPPTDLEALLGEVRAAIRASTTLRDPAVAWSRLTEEAWLERWARSEPPRRVGRRTVVAPAGAPATPRGDDILVRIVPSVAFGSAEHATTRSCLRMLERWVGPGQRVADVGAGSGILSLAAALLGAGRVHAFEMDPHACTVAMHNLEANGVADRVTLRQVEVSVGTLLEVGRFDGIVANLRAGLLIGLLPGLARALKPGGWLVVSGVVRAERAAVLRATREAELDLGGEELEDGWWTASLRRSASAP